MKALRYLPFLFYVEAGYTSGTQAKSWADAKAACEASGMKLAVPTSGSENSAVYSNWNGNNFGYWIGVTDSASEGNFVDVDGNAITYTNWQSGDPNGGASHDCVEVLYNGVWSDASCSNLRQYICESITNTGSNCELFNGQCTIQTGFSITIDTSCKAASYSQLPSDNNGLYAYPYQQNEAVTDILPSLSNTCKFDATGVIQFGFDDCGTVATVTGQNETTLTTYVNHHVIIGTSTASLMSPIAVKCYLEGVELDSSDHSVTDTDDRIEFNVTSSELVSVLNLGLDVGTLESGVFTKFTDPVPAVQIGTNIRVKLRANAVATFSYALFDCRAVSTNEMVTMYDDHCPNTNGAIFNTVWVDHTSFDMSVFKISSDATLSVKCNLRIYKDNVGFPGSCGGSGRSLNARSESTVDTEVSVNLTLTSKTSGTVHLTCSFLTVLLIMLVK